MSTEPCECLWRKHERADGQEQVAWVIDLSRAEPRGGQTASAFGPLGSPNDVETALEMPAISGQALIQRKEFTSGRRYPPDS